MNDDPNEAIEDLDAEQVVLDYRHAVEHRDAATTPEQFAEYDTMIAAMRRRWVEWQGEDCLHETAFGGSWQH